MSSSGVATSDPCRKRGSEAMSPPPLHDTFANKRICCEDPTRLAPPPDPMDSCGKSIEATLLEVLQETYEQEEAYKKALKDIAFFGGINGDSDKVCAFIYRVLFGENKAVSPWHSPAETRQSSDPVNSCDESVEASLLEAIQETYEQEQAYRQALERIFHRAGGDTDLKWVPQYIDDVLGRFPRPPPYPYPSAFL